MLTNTHVLSNTNQPFEVFCDVSHKGLSYVLMQIRKVVAYAFRKLKIHEKNYPTNDIIRCSCF